MHWLFLLAVAQAAPNAEIPPEAATVGVGTEAVIPGLLPGPPPPAEEVDPLARKIGSRLRCPVCQGLSIAASQSSAAVMIQDRIRELVAAGYSEEEITEYFIDRYGEWILLEPEAQGLNWVIWLGPGLATGLSIAWAASLAAGWRRENDEIAAPTEGETLDPYEKRLLEELGQ